MSIFSPEMTAALGLPNVAALFATRLDWPSGMSRLHSGLGQFKHFPFDMGETFYGVGNLANVGDVGYGDGDDTSPSVTLTLSSIDDATRAEVLAGGYQGRLGELYMLVMSDVGEVLAWEKIFEGVMDSASIKQGSDNTISLPLVSRDDGFDVGLNWRCTNESHQARFPGDEIYCYAEHMEDLAIYFGNKKDGIPLRELV